MYTTEDATFPKLGSFIVFFYLVFLGCQQPKDKFDFTPIEFILKDSISLQGRINHFDINKNDLFLKIEVLNFLTNQTQFFSTAIKKSGEFQLNFPLDIGGRFVVHYENKIFLPAFSQKDSIQILLQGFDKNNAAKNIYQIEKNDSILIPVQTFKNPINKLEYNFATEKKRNINAKKSQEDSFIENYHNKNYWDSLFQLKNKILKEASNTEKFLALKNDTLKLAYLETSLYHKTKGYEQEIILAKYIYELIRDKKQVSWKRSYLNYLDKMKSNQLKNCLTKIYDQKNNSTDASIHYLELNANKNILQTIKERHRGKAIYLDFWATWCIPCLKEMSIYPKLKNIVGEQVAFVYLAIDSPEKDWQSISKQWDLKGDHYLLSQAEYDMLHRLIYIETIPHYVLLNKQGQIVIDFAPKPSMGEGKTVNPVLIKSIHQILIE